MRRISLLLSAILLACTVQMTTASAQELSARELRQEVAALKRSLTNLPDSNSPRVILENIRNQVGSIVNRSMESYETFLRRSFNPTRNVFEGTNNIFDFARVTLGYNPRGNALLAALYRPDFYKEDIRGRLQSRGERMAYRRLVELGANQYRINLVLTRIRNQQNPGITPSPS
ncbi:hypothetical protein ATO13_14255 [Stappia sp. 22II-S9-Z10]|nr:hypothetical protein ATO13_14255 [Stappia sp. 22II-S9-Z10]